MEDIVMTDSNKEETVKETQAKENPLYQEYRKALVNIEKAITLKDTKTLYMYSKLLNKFRRGFTDEDCQFICDNFLRSKFHFNFVPSVEASQKVNINRQIMYN
jgi:hypothetical protein